MMKNFKLTVLVEDSVSAPKKALGLEAKHGLSILIERTKPRFTILMDTGQSPSILLQNMEILGINIQKIDAIFLSHGHYDHTGSLLEILKKINRDIPIIAHPNAFNPKFKIAPNLRYIGIPFKLCELELSRGLLLARNPVTIIERIITSGEIERITPYEKPQNFWTVENGRLIEDVMMDDQALILNLEDKGLIVVSGCAHAGIINTIKQAQKLTGIKKVHAVIGGFHLSGSRDEMIKATIDDLTKIDPAFIYPCHCTGTNNIRRLAEIFKKRCRPVKTGDTFKL